MGDDFRYQTRERLTGDHLRVNLDPLTHVVYVRREVGAHAESIRLEDRGDHRGGRALALGPCNVGNAIPVMRIAEPSHQGLESLVAELDSEAIEALEVGDS